jgi:hypothetical protein
MPSSRAEAPASEAVDPPAGAHVHSESDGGEAPVAVPTRSGTDWTKIITIAAIVLIVAGFLLFVELIHYGI